MSDVTLDLAQTDATLTTEADLGNLFSYEVTVDLPHITEATDIKMEIFAIDPVTGLGGFFICDPRVTMVGDGVNVEDGTNKTAPPRTLERKESYPSIVEKGIFDNILSENKKSDNFGSYNMFGSGSLTGNRLIGCETITQVARESSYEM